MDELRVGYPVVAGNVTLVPIERCLLQSDTGDMGCWLSGFKEPFAIVVCEAAGVRAFNANAAEMPVASLVRILPDLGPFLAALAP